jgi:hypothetical protein
MVRCRYQGLGRETGKGGWKGVAKLSWSMQNMGILNPMLTLPSSLMGE